MRAIRIPAIKLAVLAAASLAAAEKGANVTLFTAVDVGRVENGYDLAKNHDPSGLALNRTYVDVGFRQQLDERYLLSIGVGGIFWKAYEGGGGTPEDKVIKFGPGISNAFMKASFTENLDLTFGYFPYKYNMAAKNLGEYLFRTEAYPTIVYTGGWSWMNDVQYRTVGLKLGWTALDGKLHQDIGIFGEYFNAPIYDLSPAYIATYKPIAGITLGGAGSLHRFITPTPKTRDELTKPYAYRQDFFLPEVQAKAKYNIGIDSYVGNHETGTTLKFKAGGAPNVDSLRNAIFAEDSATLRAIHNIQSAAAIPLNRDTSALASSPGRAAKRESMLEKDIVAQAKAEGSDSATYFGDPANAASRSQTVSFDLAAVKLLAFFELDINALLGLDAKRLGEFSLYGEVAQLGLKNYPIFYTESAQRRPIMLGASVPTFGLLDHLSIEMEYLKNPNYESIASTYDKLDLAPDENFRYRAYAKDDTKWSVHATRTLSQFLSVHVQVANDHMRLKDGFARPQYLPVTNETGSWYWLTRFQWMM